MQPARRAGIDPGVEIALNRNREGRRPVMSFGEINSRPAHDLLDLPQEGEEQAYTLLEEARLRCEQLTADEPEDRVSLRKIHRELGLAGWLASSELAPDRRLALLDNAHQRSTTALLHPAQSPHALATAAITADDALADTEQTEHLHLAHLHLLCAMGLLAHHL